MGENSVHQLVAAQFGASAASYTTSPTHRDQASLAVLVDLVQPNPSDALLDIATGTGHTGLAFASKVASVIGYDLTTAMLEEAVKLAEVQQAHNFTVRQGSAEELPFESESFDIVTVRTAPHHFADVPAFLSESFRVLKRGGKFLMVDTTVPENEQVDAEMNRIEMLRDPSHVRNYTSKEWSEMVQVAGFTVTHIAMGMHAGGKQMEIQQWMDRMKTSPENRVQILGAFADPTPELVEAMDIERRDGTIWFSLPELTLLATK